VQATGRVASAILSEVHSDRGNDILHLGPGVGTFDGGGGKNTVASDTDLGRRIADRLADMIVLTKADLVL
jgi:hypothetical protein